MARGRKRIWAWLLMIAMVITLVPNIGVYKAEASENYKTWAQYDSRWGYIQLGDSNVATYGCCATAVLKLGIQAGLKNPDNYNVGTFVNEGKTNGSFSSGGGIVWSAAGGTVGLTYFYYGLTVNGQDQRYYLSENTSKVLGWLKEGYHIVLWVPSPIGTSSGHYVAIDEYNSSINNEIWIMDNEYNGPMSTKYSYFYGTISYLGGTSRYTNPDSTAPEVSGVYAHGITNKGFTIDANVTDNVGVMRVWACIWPDNTTWENGKEILATSVGGNKYSITVNIADFDDYQGLYHVDYYAADSVWNTGYSLGTTVGPLDAKPPQIDYIVADNSIYNTLTIEANVTDIYGINRVDLVIGPSYLPESSWYHYRALSSDGIQYSYSINSNEFSNYSGEYAFKMYAYSKSGAWTCSDMRTTQMRQFMETSYGTIGEHRYELYANQVTWNDARKYADRLGGHLVTITSDEENSIVSSLVKNTSDDCDYYWIGATDEDAEGNFQWITGEPFTYTNYKEGEPNGLSSDEDYLMIYKSLLQWNDARNEVPSGYIVEYDSPTCETHQWDEGTVTFEPTCVKEGVRIYTCEVCGETKQETIPANGHIELIDNEVKATCTKGGKTEGSHCSVCGEVIKAQEEVPANGHTKVVDVAVNATCTEIGKTEGSHCSTCGKIMNSQKEIPALGHSWDTGKVTKAATCTTAGVKIYTCKNCGTTRTETIKATGHKKVTDKAVAATYTKTGKTAGSHCSVCGKVIVAQKTVPKLVKNGLFKESGKTYYYFKGVKQKGWQKVDKVWHYFDKKSGAMKTGWMKDGKKWYYFDKKSGTMKTGWMRDGKKWYYFDKKSGTMKTGWMKDGKKWYYFSPKATDLGQMVTGKLKIGKKIYKFNTKGVCLNP